MLLNTRVAEVDNMLVGPKCSCVCWAHVGGMLRGPIYTLYVKRSLGLRWFHE